MRPRSERGLPRTSAVYSRSSACSRTRACRRAYASSVFATTSSPDVSRSMRWTIPRRSSSPPRATPTRPCTSVPVSWPGAGWTTRPADLSITSRCSSSYATSRPSSSRCSGCGSAGCSNSTSSPPWSRHAFARATPSTRTPAATTRSAAAREPTCCATNASSREPAASSGTRTRRAVRGEQREQQDADADDDERVGEVERRPELQVEKVRHVSESHPVDEVRDAAADARGRAPPAAPDAASRSARRRRASTRRRAS